MQTEDMKRLLVKDENSKSGYRINGYLWYKNGKLFCSTNIDTTENDWLLIAGQGVFSGYSYIFNAAYEQGILVDGVWWFEGDRVKHIQGRVTDNMGEGEIVYTEGTFFIQWDKSKNNLESCRRVVERIGSIHEEKADDK